jgi:HSP20 family protein
MSTLDLARTTPFDDRWFRALFGRPWFGNGDANAAAAMPLDLYEKDGKVCCEAAMPGVALADVKVSVHDGVLTIRGEHSDERNVKEGDYYLREYATGTYARSIRLPEDVEADQASATLDKGILKVTFPKTVAARGKTVEVKVQPQA